MAYHLLWVWVTHGDHNQKLGTLYLVVSDPALLSNTIHKGQKIPGSGQQRTVKNKLNRDKTKLGYF